MGFDDILGAIFFILVFGSVLFLAAVVSRFFAAKASKAMQGKHIKIIENLAIGMDKRLLLVKAGKEYLLLSSSGKTVTFIANVKLDSAEVESTAPGGLPPFSFKPFLEKYMQGVKPAMGSSKQKTDDEPAYDGMTAHTVDNMEFRNNLDRLKKMVASTSIQSKEDKNEETKDE